MIDRIQSDLTRAMKSGDRAAVETLRMLLSAVRYATLDQKRDLQDQEAAAVVQKAIRSRRESVEAFRKGNREELALKEEAETAVLERYLPAQMDGAELGQAVGRIPAEGGT